MLSCALDAKESQYIVITDILGAFLHVDMEGIVHMKLKGDFAEIFVNLHQSHTRTTYCIFERKADVVCAIKKALIGTLQAALLFWKLLSNKLQEWGFKIN